MKVGLGNVIAVALAMVIFLQPSSMLAQEAAFSNTIERINPLTGIGLSSLRSFTERPLFSPTRRTPKQAEPEVAPDEPAAETTEILNIRLLGVVVTPDNTVAHVEDLDDTKSRVLKVGDTIHSWTIKSIDATGLVMEKDSEIRHFTLFKTSEP